MPLTDDEAVEAFRFLVDALRDNGLAWVITQVEEKIALGKVRTKKLRAREVQAHIEGLWELEDLREPTSRRGALFAVAEQYTPQERLHILIDSISIAVPVVNEIADRTFANLEEFGIHDRIDFEPEAEVSHSFSLLAKEIGFRAEANMKLRELLEELRRGEIIGNPPQPTR
jgi:hypothetical protein